MKFYVYNESVMKIMYIDSQNVHKAIEKLWWIIDREKFYKYSKLKFNVDKIKFFVRSVLFLLLLFIGDDVVEDILKISDVHLFAVWAALRA